MKLIGLTGPAGSGKDTVARFLCDTHGFVQIAFADPIRAGVKAMYGLTDEHFTDRFKKETVIPELGKSPRQLMQGLGDWMRAENPDILVYLASLSVELIHLRSQWLHIGGIVISDVRKENEASYIRNLGTLWHVHRTTLAYTGLASNARFHSTEQGVAWHASDRIIHNSGSIDFLLDSVGHIFSEEEPCSTQK